MIFTLFTVTIGALLTLVTKKTGPVWPAAFLHAANNAGANILGLCYSAEKLSGIATESTVCFLIQTLPACLIGVTAAIVLCRQKKMEQ